MASGGPIGTQAGVVARIAALLQQPAEQARVAEVRIGLGYTAVRLMDDRTGLAFTFHRDAGGGCSVFRGLRPLAGRPAIDLLALLDSTDPIESAVGLACANALTAGESTNLREGDILDQLDLRAEDHVAMVGHFGPLVQGLRERASSLTVFERIERVQGYLRPEREAEDVLPKCQTALITATSIINRTIDRLLEAAMGCRVVAIVGPSTPLLPDAFSTAHVTLLSGIVVQNAQEVLRVVSEGGGMRQFSPYVRKVSLPIPT